MYENIVTCREVSVRDLKTGFGSDDWIVTLYTPLGTTSNYNAIAISTLYRSLLHTLVSSVYYTLHQSFPGNGFVSAKAHQGNWKP
jgi:hypothetical protein